MTASEFAFLALGLVLGVASGAALIEVLRARPPVAREVRVTVAPNAIHARLAATLADPHGVGRRGRPGAWRTRRPALARRDRARPASRPRPARRSRPAATVATAVSDDSGRPDLERLFALRSRHAATAMVAVPMSHRARRRSRTGPPGARRSRLAAMAAICRDDDRRGPDRRRRRPSGRGAEARRRRARATVGGGPSHRASGEPRTAGGPAATPVSAAGSGAGLAGAAASAARRSTPPAAGGPCAEERRVADERCAVADPGARGRGRGRRRSCAAPSARTTSIVARAEAAAAAADPRAVRTAKEQAQQRFRDARNRARTRDDVEAGARDWLAEINRINHDTREAALADRARPRGGLGPRADRRAPGRRGGRGPDLGRAGRRGVRRGPRGRGRLRRGADAGGGRGAIRGARSRPRPVAAGDDRPTAGPDRGRDPGARGRVRVLHADELAGRRGRADPADPARRPRGDAARGRPARAATMPRPAAAGRPGSAALAEALIARSIEASAFDFPIDHPFWGPFNQTQNRDIAAGLSSLGFRFDGFGDWVDERVAEPARPVARVGLRRARPDADPALAERGRDRATCFATSGSPPTSTSPGPPAG